MIRLVAEFGKNRTLREFTVCSGSARVNPLVSVQMPPLVQDVKNGDRIEKIVKQIIQVSNDDAMNWVIKCWGQKIKEYNYYNTNSSPIKPHK